MDQDIFSLIRNEMDKIKLFKDLALSRGEILCKGQSENLCRLSVTSFNDKSQHIECESDMPGCLQNLEEYVGYFFLGGEKYYFQGKVEAHYGRYSLSLPTELYRLQRRQNYRVKVPEGYQATFTISHVNGKPLNLPTTMADISSQGCRIDIDKKIMMLNTGDKVVGMLKVGNRNPFELSGAVRHAKINELNKSLQNIGIEFTPLSSILENKLFSITLELHKEFFKRP